MRKQTFTGRMEGFKPYYSAFDTVCQKIFQCFLSLKKDNNPSSESTYFKYLTLEFFPDISFITYTFHRTVFSPNSILAYWQN